MGHDKNVFVTVGTTKFEKLIDTILTEDILNELAKQGYNDVHIQFGNSTEPSKFSGQLNLKYYKFIEDFIEQVQRADLIISHAGAGTCLEVLKARKPLIVVINEDLMDNHQTELAKQLEKEKYAYYCNCNNLKETLSKDVNNLRPYPKTNKMLFTNYLNKCMGYK